MPPAAESSSRVVRYISASQAADIDKSLMSSASEGGASYKLEQLMELAGLACATGLAHTFPLAKYSKVLVAAGPGNQGGDGLVAARHLAVWGYEVAVWYPKQSQNDFIKTLQEQCAHLDLDFVPTDEFEDAFEGADVVLDAVFGFSYKGPPRAPFKEALESMQSESRMEFESRRPRPPIVSVDVPSGWDVDAGDAEQSNFMPEVLVSLTAPKAGVRHYTGRHLLGGRFVPPRLAREYALVAPPYNGSDQIVDITGVKEISEEDARELWRRQDEVVEDGADDGAAGDEEEEGTVKGAEP